MCNDITICHFGANGRHPADPTTSRRIEDVGVLLRYKEQSTVEDVSKRQCNTRIEASWKAKREWARRNASHKKAYAVEWYEKNKEAISIKRKAKRDALKANPINREL